MEEVTVVIVGAGPSGLVLGALLARMNVKVVILEKEKEICEDPRGIVINGDAVRISYQVGIGDALTQRIGKDIGVLHFHSGNFRTRSFMNFDLTVDWAEQSVSNNIAQFQPNFEREIRKELTKLPSCQLITGCEVVSRTENDEQTIVEYLTSDGTSARIKTSWLVGADGKRGVVRKRFLEPEGIRQVDGDWKYVGTWVAANLKTTTPTPKSHPDFTLWDLNYTPEEVHSLFWPSGFHFCNDPQRPAVSGRFGPKNSNCWRHEYSVEENDNTDNVEQEFWNHFAPWLVVPGSKISTHLRGMNITWPHDCIEILRCRPFTFATKVVNRWFCRKTLLIGDAAHVFPPFGGQGIATGIRDAQALSWRLAMLSALPAVSVKTRERILTGWSQERRHAWDVATQSTKINGSIVNNRSSVGGFVYRIWMRFLYALPGMAKRFTRRIFHDKLAYNATSCPEGFFLESEGGGRKMAQVWLARPGEAPKLSDAALFRDPCRLSVLALVRSPPDLDVHAVEQCIEASQVPPQVIAPQDITFVSVRGNVAYEKHDHVYSPCESDQLLQEGISPIRGYNSQALQERVGPDVKYVILRPDFFIHSVARDRDELSRNLQHVKEYFEG